MDEVLNLFGLLSDRTRLRILLLLQQRELCVCEIFAALDMSQPRVSRQLAILKQARLIRDNRKGKWIYYRIEENVHTKNLMSILPMLPEWLEEDPEYKRDQEMLHGEETVKNNPESCSCKNIRGDGNEEQ